jgi:hypothetical protein
MDKRLVAGAVQQVDAGLVPDVAIYNSTQGTSGSKRNDIGRRPTT